MTPTPANGEVAQAAAITQQSRCTAVRLAAACEMHAQGTDVLTDGLQ